MYALKRGIGRYQVQSALGFAQPGHIEGARYVSDTATSRAELRTKMRELFQRTKQPTLPMVAHTLLGLFEDPNATFQEFAKVLETDGNLAGRLMKVANSAYFGVRHKATTVERAVINLGLRYVKAIALGFQLVKHVDRLGTAEFDLKGFWRESLFRASLARTLASRCVPDREDEAFLIGLMLDCGIPLLIQIDGVPYATLLKSGHLSPTALHKVEQESFGHTHTDAASAIMEEWNIPDLLANPIIHHHRRPAGKTSKTEEQKLSTLAYFVGSLCMNTSNKVLEPSEKGLANECMNQLGLKNAEFDEAMQDGQNSYMQLASMFPEVLPNDTDISDILMRANEHLAQLAGSAEMNAVNLAEEKERIEKQVSTLSESMQEYKERATTDSLTGLDNRWTLTEHINSIIEEHDGKGNGLMVMFADIDHFKRLNDTYGHLVGDNVLGRMGNTIRSTFANARCVARYGGEEFVVLRLDCPRDIAARDSERLRARVETMDMNREGLGQDNVTISIGTLWLHPHVKAKNGEELLKLTDKLLYAAKNEGRNRAKFLPIDTQLAGRLGWQINKPRSMVTTVTTPSTAFADRM